MSATTIVHYQCDNGGCASHQNSADGIPDGWRELYPSTNIDRDCDHVCPVCLARLAGRPIRPAAVAS